MIAPTPEEYAQAFGLYCDRQRHRRAAIPASLNDALSDPMTTASLKCIVIELRERTKRRIQSAPHRPRRPAPVAQRRYIDQKMRAAGERDDDDDF